MCHNLLTEVDWIGVYLLYIFVKPIARVTNEKPSTGRSDCMLEVALKYIKQNIKN